MVTKVRELPPQTFITTHKAADGSGLSRFMSFSSAEWLIRETAEECGVSLLGLGILVGLPDPHAVYQWTAGYRRPAPVYAARLHALALIGKEAFWIERINWVTGEIKWKPGVKQVA